MYYGKGIAIFLCYYYMYVEKFQTSLKTRLRAWKRGQAAVGVVIAMVSMAPQADVNRTATRTRTAWN